MRFPNLLYALHLRKLAQYQVAQELKVTESALSRRLAGRVEFSALEREQISELLGFDADWLFAQPVPPRRRAGASASPPLALHVAPGVRT